MTTAAMIKENGRGVSAWDRLTGRQHLLYHSGTSHKLEQKKKKRMLKKHIWKEGLYSIFFASQWFSKMINMEASILVDVYEENK